MQTGAYDLDSDLSFSVVPVGVMRSPFRVHQGTPRQAAVADEDIEGTIHLKPGLQNLVKDLAGFSHIWLVFWFNYSRGWNETVKPPRDTEFRGLFATRAPHRPNPIGLSVVPLKHVRHTTLTVGTHDLLDGTPILDIKPYIPYADALPEAQAGWVDALGPGAGPDHRDWRAEKGYEG